MMLPVNRFPKSIFDGMRYGDVGCGDKGVRLVVGHPISSVTASPLAMASLMSREGRVEGFSAIPDKVFAGPV